MKFLDQVKIYVKAGTAVVALLVSEEKNLLNLVVLTGEMEVKEDLLS